MYSHRFRANDRKHTTGKKQNTAYLQLRPSLGESRRFKDPLQKATGPIYGFYRHKAMVYKPFGSQSFLKSLWRSIGVFSSEMVRPEA